nr:15187_t:CDS:10 [Entrophospora candida]
MSCDQSAETIIDTSRQDSQSSTPSIVRGMSNQLQINTEVIQEDEEMDDVDELGRIKELMDNNTHQDLSFTSQSPEANSYIHLYQEIVKAEAENDTTSQNVLQYYYQFRKKISKRFEYYKNVKKYRDPYFQTNTTWSLLGYLKYKERENDFTSDKSTEHMSYVKNLEYLKENLKECQQIKQCLCNLKPAEYALVGDSGYEKTSEDVNSFWQSINMKKQLDIKKVSVVFSINSLCFRLTDLEYEIVAPLEHSDDVYHNKIGSNVIIPRNQVISTNKRKREDQSDYEESALLFDKSNEDTTMENIDEKTLEQEIKLPLASVNSSLKCKYVSDEKCKSLTIYGWLQIGLELNFYSMDWSGNGIYRFGLVDQCRLPSDKDECGMLEDVYCILKLLESKSLETEKLVKSLFLENTKGK